MKWFLRRVVFAVLVCCLSGSQFSCGSSGETGGSPTTVVASAVGGWVEKDGAGIRSRYTAAQIQSFVPTQRGPFTFPAPYNTQAVRITDASDCGGNECVWNVGYCYWRNTYGSHEMLIFLGLATERGGSGATLFTYDKTTDVVTKAGPLFPSGSRFNYAPAVGWYFSGTRPTTLYLNDGPRMLRYDVATQQFETVYDITAQFGTNRNIWQMHSSNDDQVYSATLRFS